jgi:hypothetical protein
LQLMSHWLNCSLIIKKRNWEIIITIWLQLWKLAKLLMQSTPDFHKTNCLKTWKKCLFVELLTRENLMPTQITFGIKCWDLFNLFTFFANCMFIKGFKFNSCSQ